LEAGNVEAQAFFAKTHKTAARVVDTLLNDLFSNAGDEGTVRRDRKYLETPENERPIRKAWPKKQRKVKPAYDPDCPASLELHVRRMLKALKAWIDREPIWNASIEDVLHCAGKLLFEGRGQISHFPVSVMSPAELLSPTRLTEAKWSDFPNSPDFFADWLARWLAVCLPRQDEIRYQVLKEASLWVRSRSPRFIY
jgi:hypothetical protein